jgi:hypothetical protein
MATVLEEYTTEKQSSVMPFFGVGEGFNAKDIQK